MHTMTLKVDDTVYSKLMALLELFPKNKIKIEEKYDRIPNKTTLEAIEEIETKKTTKIENFREYAKELKTEY